MCSLLTLKRKQGWLEHLWFSINRFECNYLFLRLNSISETTAVKPVKGRDTEMYPIEFNYFVDVKINAGRVIPSLKTHRSAPTTHKRRSKFNERQLRL